MDQKTGSGRIGDCSAEQLASLKLMRVFAASLGCSETEYDDHYLLRFLRARAFIQDKAEKMFGDFIEWRKSNNVDNIKDFHFTELPEVRQYYPHGYHRVDKQGRPVYIERIGVLKLSQVFTVTTQERLVSYYIQSYEMLMNRIFPASSEFAGHRIDQTVTILDLKGFSMKMVTKQAYNFIQLASKLAQENYPEILGKMFIVNAPMLFSGIWAIIKPWIDENTRNKITIIGSGFKEKLLEIVSHHRSLLTRNACLKIDADQLPDFLGGNSKTDLSTNIGPWNPTGNELFPINEKTTDEIISGQQQFNLEGSGDSDSEDEQTRNAARKAARKAQEVDDEDDEEAADFAALRNALSGNISGPMLKAPHNPDKYEITTQGAHFQVSDTPLNTQAEEDY